MSPFETMVGACMVCRQKNEVSNMITKSQQVLSQMNAVSSCATKAQIKEAQRRIDQNPWLLRICDTTHKCKMGMTCSHMNTSQLDVIAKEMSKTIVLLHVMNKDRQFLQSFQGRYPKAAAYISRR